MSQKPFLLINENIKMLKKIRRSLFKIHLEGALSTKLLSERDISLSTKLGSALLAYEAAQSEEFRIEGLKKEIEEARVRQSRSTALVSEIQAEVNAEFTEEEATSYFRLLDRLDGKDEEMKILPGGGLLL